MRRDDELVDAIRHVLDGDRERYEEIYKLTDQPLRGFIGARFGRLGDSFVDEAAIRTHEYTLERLSEFDPGKGASFQTWLNHNSRSITAVMIREWYGGRLVGFAEAEHEERAPSSPGPEELRERAERDRAVMEELELLSEPGRSCVRSCDVEDCTMRAAAARLKMSASGVSRFRRVALAKLRRQLTRRGIRPAEILPPGEPALWRFRSEDGPDEACVTASPTLPFVPGTRSGAEPWPTRQDEPARLPGTNRV